MDLQLVILAPTPIRVGRTRHYRRAVYEPVVTPLGRTNDGWEGCLSVPRPAGRGAALVPHSLHRV
jgi:peptide deformylase